MLRIEIIILGLIMIVLIALIWLWPTLEQFRCQRIKEQAFPSPWETIIQHWTLDKKMRSSRSSFANLISKEGATD